MAVSVYANGTQTCVVGTEEFVSQVSATGVFSFHVDLAPMQTGDIIELRVYQVILTGGTSRVLLYQAYYGAQVADDEIKMSFPVGNDLTNSTSLEYSIKQTFGTGRAIPWKVLEYS